MEKLTEKAAGIQFLVGTPHPFRDLEYENLVST
jgi:hypothetical protein